MPGSRRRSFGAGRDWTDSSTPITLVSRRYRRRSAASVSLGSCSCRDDLLDLRRAWVDRRLWGQARRPSCGRRRDQDQPCVDRGDPSEARRKGQASARSPRPRAARLAAAIRRTHPGATGRHLSAPCCGATRLLPRPRPARAGRRCSPMAARAGGRSGRDLVPGYGFAPRRGRGSTARARRLHRISLRAMF